MMVNVNSQYQRAVHQHQQSHSFIDTTQRSYIPPFIMTSIKRSNAVTLHPSSLCDDDIEAALKTNLLAKNEKEAADAIL
jgi:hypothetical protein